MQFKEGWRAPIIGLVAISLNVQPACAASGTPEGAPSELIFFAQIGVLVLVGRLLGEILQRFGQPAVMGQLVGGLLLGPSVFGLLAPESQHALFPGGLAQKSMIDAVSQLGILLLLLLAGMETDLKLVRKTGAAAIAVSVAGIALPFACGFVLGEFIPQNLLPNPDQRLITALFLGTALSISSVKIVAVVVREMNFMRRDLGQVILAAAVIDDTIGWIIIAITFSLATHGEMDLVSVARAVFGTVIFLGFSLTIGRRIVASLIRWANDNVVSEVPVISVIVLIMIVMAMVTQAIGVHSVLGAFVAGILVGESPILTRQIDQQLRGLIMGLFAPVFFGMAGLASDLTILKNSELMLLTAALIAIATIGKASGAFVGGRVGGLNFRESLALACGMNARGSTEVIVATIGLGLGILSHEMFTMIVAMAVITTLAMPPMLRWSLGRLPLRPAEADRLARETADSKGFIANIERILVAVDDGDSGKYASQLAGLITGSRGKPTTVLHIEPAGPIKSDEHADHPAEHVRTSAKTGADAEEGRDEPRPNKVEVTAKGQPALTREAVAEEARNGYDLLVIGVGGSRTAAAKFNRDVGEIAGGFEGSLAIVAARGGSLAAEGASGLKILLPFTGTAASRRAAELAIAIARAVNGSVTALHITTPSTGKSPRQSGAVSLVRRSRKAILDQFRELAELYGATARTKVCADKSPEQAILDEAHSGRFDLIVLGVNRRVGDVMFFGEVAAAVLDHAETSLVLVSDAVETGRGGGGRESAGTSAPR